jgi:hypothetical protein
MLGDERHIHRWRTSLFIGLSLFVLVPLVACALLRFDLIVPAEFSINIRPLRIATTCFSRKRFCLPMENANPPPRELFILIDWPGGDRSEDVLVAIPLK